MISATVLAVFFVPVFFIFVMKWTRSGSETNRPSVAHDYVISPLE